MIGTKKTVVRDGKGCCVRVVDECSGRKEKDVCVAGRVVEEIRCFEEAVLVCMDGALEWMHVADKGETVGREFGEPELRVFGVHLVPVGLSIQNAESVIVILRGGSKG